MSEDQAEYGLVMPFLLAASNGGPYDDAAFVSGVRIGSLDTQLRLAAAFPEMEPKGLYAEPVEREQIDLIAMRHGFVMTATEYDEHWTLFEFTRASMSHD